MADTCLACDNPVPGFSTLCEDHIWIAAFETYTDEAVVAAMNGKYQAADYALDMARRKLRGVRDGT